MNWQDILTLATTTVVPLAAFLAWVYNRIDKKFERIDKKFEKVDDEFKEIRRDLQDIRKDLQTLDSRVARIEGHLTGLYHFEARQGKKTGTEDKK